MDKGEGDREEQRERHEEFARNRKSRGEIRDAHLEGGRAQARREAAGGREEAKAQPHQEPQQGRASETEQPEATFEERIEAAEATVKAEARGLHGGTDEEFERDWPAIREKLISEALQERGGDTRRGGL